MKGKGMLTCPQPRQNELQQDGLDGLICILLCEDMVGWSLTSTQGNLEGMKKIWEATLASGAEVNHFCVPEVTARPFQNTPKKMRLFSRTRCGLW